MRNIVSVTVDEKGDLHVDLSGYVGGSCEFEESELIRILKELGIRADIKSFKSKTQDIQQNTQTQTKNVIKIKT